jgi:hypothetical protein
MSTLEDDRTVSDDQLEDLERSFAAPTATESGSAKLAAKAPTMEDEDGAADDTVGSGYTSGKKKVTVNRRWWNKRRAKIAGGLAGAGVTGGILGMTFLSGPLEFIHLAEVLHNTHLAQQEDVSDGRLGKMFRYFRSNLDAGETRLGYVGSKYKSRILSQMKDIGLEPKFNSTTGYFEGMQVDTTSEKSPYHGMDAEEAIKAIETDYGGTVKGSNGKFNVSEIGTKYRAQTKALRSSVSAMGDSKLSSAARMRVLKKYGFVTWHPLKIVDKKANSKATDIAKGLKEKWDNRIKNGIEPAAGDASTTNSGTDENGKPIPASDAEKATVVDAPKNAKGILSSIAESKSAKITGGVAAVAGLACALKSVDDNIASIKYYQMMVPMIRVGLDAVAVGEQIKSGQDVDPAELSYLSHYLNSTDATTGQTTSWNDAESIRTNNGEAGGVPADANLVSTIKKGKPSWLDWTQSSAMSGMCSTVGSAVTTVISFGVSVISGDTVSAAVSGIVGYVAAPKIIGYVSDLLAGDALDVDNLAGAAYGTVADFGTTLGANAAALGMGGVELTAAQLGEVNQQTTQEQTQAFDSEGFFARTFDLKDYRSLASVMLAGSSNSFTRNLASTANGIIGTFSSVLHMPLRLFGSMVHAAPTPYQYPFATYGFSLADQNNSAVEDPYSNADDVSKLLDTNGQGGTPDYITKALDCFGVQITKGSEGWDVLPSKDINVYDSDNYSSGDCADTGDANWLKVRFFVLDTGTMEGYACAVFNDAESCTNDGATATGAQQ